VKLWRLMQLRATSFAATVQTSHSRLKSQKPVNHPSVRTRHTPLSVKMWNGVGYCYILSQGLVAAIIPWSVKGAVTDGSPALCQPYTLKAGDIVKVMNSAAATRLAAAAVYTASGVSRIFTKTVSGGATNELTDLQTGNSIGNTIFGDRISKWFGTSVDGLLIETQGFFVVDALGNVVGSCSATDPVTQQPAFAMANVPIALNYKFQFLTSA